MSNNSSLIQKQNNNNSYKLWILQAKFDLSASKKSIQFQFNEWACYQAVQAVEKALKSVIIHSGWRAPQTHKLGILLSICNQTNKSFINVKFNYRKIEAYTFLSRYPFVIPNDNLTPHDLIDEQDAIACISVAENIISKVNKFLENTSARTGDELDLEKIYYTDEEIRLKIEGLVNVLKNDPILKVSKVTLFGSFSKQTNPSRTSTMDILIVAETSLPFIQRIQYLRNIIKGSEPILEPLIYTPDELEIMIHNQGEGYLESAIEEGRVIYKV